MTMRTIAATVTFGQPFVLDGFDEVLPAGTYKVETDEERLDGVSFPAYRRTSTVIFLPGKQSRSGESRALTIDPKSLDAALERDRARGPAPPAQGGSGK